MADCHLEAEQILKGIGGKENIQDFTCCFTRLRFVLKNLELVQTEELQKLESVKGILTRPDSYQIVIGMAASRYYKELKQLCMM